MKRYINHLSKTQKQWTWFALLWCGGVLSMLLMGSVIKWIMGI